MLIGNPLGEGSNASSTSNELWRVERELRRPYRRRPSTSNELWRVERELRRSYS